MPLAKKIEEPKVSSDDKLPKVVLGVLFLFLGILIIMGLSSCRVQKKVSPVTTYKLPLMGIGCYDVRQVDTNLLVNGLHEVKSR